MSLINFLHPRFKTEIETSCIPEDDYKPSNLISENLWKRDRGFMAYNLTKPPVDLTFHLEHCVEVHRIKIWPSNGSLRSTAFEVQVFNKENPVVVGKCSQTDRNAIEFYQERMRNAEPASNGDTLAVRFFSSAFIYRSLKNTKSIKLTITSTKRCAPVLKRIEIWGRPSRQLDRESGRKCENVWREISAPTSDRKSTTTTKASSMEVNNEQHCITPDEFCDSITYEIMLFPMRLPCGKAVDQSTIARHSEIEEKWGRAPSDPFTAKLFTAKSKPILDVALKARIDKFLIENSERTEFRNVPRTLGRKTTGASIKPPINSIVSYCNPEKSAKRTKLNRDTTTVQAGSVSLDDAVQNALLSIRKRAANYTQTSKGTNTQCFACNSTTYLYKIQTCSHLICRICLNSLKDSNVCACSVQFVNSDVERFFQ